MTSPSRPTKALSTESLTTEDQVQAARLDEARHTLKLLVLQHHEEGTKIPTQDVDDIELVLTALSEALSGRDAALKEVAELRDELANRPRYISEHELMLSKMVVEPQSTIDALMERLTKYESANAKLSAELAESARLHGMGSEREAALLAKMDQAKRELSAEKVHHIHTAQCLREELAEASAKIEELAIGHARYEYLRKLNPRQFTELYQQNISTAVPFDTLVDEARVATREASRAPTAGENNERKDFV